MSKVYHIANYDIEEYELIKKTDKSITYNVHYKYLKKDVEYKVQANHYDWKDFFLTYEEAKAEMVSRLESALLKYQDSIRRVESALEEYKEGYLRSRNF